MTEDEAIGELITIEKKYKHDTEDLLSKAEILLLDFLSVNGFERLSKEYKRVSEGTWE